MTTPYCPNCLDDIADGQGNCPKCHALKAYGLSQVELAERAGLGERKVQRCETGKTAITIRTLVRCDKVLGGELIAKIIS